MRPFSYPVPHRDALSSSPRPAGSQASASPRRSRASWISRIPQGRPRTTAASLDQLELAHATATGVTELCGGCGGQRCERLRQRRQHAVVQIENVRFLGHFRVESFTNCSFNRSALPRSLRPALLEAHGNRVTDPISEEEPGDNH